NEELLLKVRRYQASMLRDTYRDLAEDGGCKRLLTFILDAIYTPEDINAPTEAFKKVYGYFTDKPKGKPIIILSKLMELNRLSEELDRSLAQKISEAGLPAAGQTGGQAGEAVEITDAVYEGALRACNNRKDRERHTELFVECITSLHQLTRHPLNAFMFKVIKLLMSYLGRPKAIKVVEEGYNAFVGIEDISQFTNTIKEKELERLERVYGS
ncbi:MAG: hypothetical protein ACE5IC_08640, partial [Candidatus Brocadiales bacterium]